MLNITEIKKFYIRTVVANNKNNEYPEGLNIYYLKDATRIDGEME